MKIRTEKEMSLTLWPGDTLTVCEDRVDADGEMKRTVFVTDEIEKDMVINKIVTFDVEKGDFGGDVVGGIGAAFLVEEAKTEQAETPKKPELLVEMFKVIADTYAAGEVDEAMRLLRDEISKAAGHYHDLQKEHIYRGTGVGSF